MLGPTHRMGGIAFGALMPIVIEKVMGVHINEPLLFASVSMAGGAIGSLIPDIDSPSSTIGRRMKVVSRFIAETLGHRGGTHTLICLLIFGFFTIFLGDKLQSFLSGNLTEENRLIFSIIVAFIIMTSAMFIVKHVPLQKGKITKLKGTGTILLIFIITVLISFSYSSILLHYVKVYLLGVVVGYASHIFLDMFTRAGVPFFKPFTDYRVSFTNYKTGSGIEDFTKVISTVVIVLSIITLGKIQL